MKMAEVSFKRLFIRCIVATCVFLLISMMYQRRYLSRRTTGMLPGHIAVLIPSTTRKIEAPSLGQLSLTTLCIPSIKQTVEPTFQYRVYIGTEQDDYLAKQFDSLRAMSSNNIQITPMIVAEGGTFTKVVNAIALQAYNDGAEYLTFVTDDTKFLTKNWTSFAIETLKNYKPRNIGVVGPMFKEGNTEILTHSMVHRSHLDIFKFYFPPVFTNWYGDDWLTRVYLPNRSTKLLTWEISHTLQYGMRYTPNASQVKWLMPLLILGRMAVNIVCKSNSFKPTLRVISYSLFGSSPQYTGGALENAKLASQIYPGWSVRVYHDDTVPSPVTEALRSRNVTLVNISAFSPEIPDYIFALLQQPKLQLLSNALYTPVKDKTIWNLFVAFDPTVERYIIRNTDSALSWRERAAVDQWIYSGKRFHVMRDHPFHSYHSVPSGLWGGTHDAVPDIVSLIREYSETTKYASLQVFLNKEIWPLATSSVIQHDAFSCEKYEGSIPFPTQWNGWEYVGSAFTKIGRDDIDVLKKTQQPAKCSSTKLP